MRDADDPCLVRLLGALSAALGHGVDADRRGELAALARSVLEDVRGRWDAGHQPLALAPLEAWFEAAGRLTEPPPAPDVAPTWFELLPSPDVDETQTAGEWLALVEILGRHDPTMLRRLGNPARVEAVAGALAEMETIASSPPEGAHDAILASFAESRLVERVLLDL